uniref:Small ribosomal subunit protein uS14c n=1 Tax=Nitzschia sp. IriIs04 TaxID=1444690 RepID=A0A0S3QPI5_9STRA|nr:ribosomal protein S14 [Nitzschia sp. IriIs04]BAT70255.1 ribosomal protein S14 [Nitzschia sp. IriIs04]
MSKKNMIEREKKKFFLIKKYSLKRKNLLFEYKKQLNFSNKILVHSKLQKCPKNSAKVRLRKICWKTGRSRGILRDFGLSRHIFREMAHNGLLPGIVKSSW